jgi:hypothetical protein
LVWCLAWLGTSREKLREGVEVWNEWRESNPDVAVDLSEADLSREDLSKAHLSDADLSRAKLSGANLSQADLSTANLRDADVITADLSDANLSDAMLRGANLKWAYLIDANLSTADLRNADLSYAHLSGANLSGTNQRGVYLYAADFGGAEISGTHLGSTVFANTDLSGVKGLELCVHDGPSSLGIDTIFRSKGEIPDVFLRGCGVPEQFITYARSLVSQGIEFYSCFISYSTRDQEFADRLHADLQNKGVRCWFAPHDIQGGRKIHEQIDEAIRVYDRLLLILSEESMKSSWVETEIAKARKRESKEGRQMLFPVRLVDFETLRDWESFDADTGKDSAREIREYFIPDFSRWKDHDSYKKAFDRLLKDLTAKGDGPRA